MGDPSLAPTVARRNGAEVLPADFPRLTRDLETAIFRVIQEALTNVFRHSEARKTWVTLSRQDDQVMLTIGDDGNQNWSQSLAQL